MEVAYPYGAVPITNSSQSRNDEVAVGLPFCETLKAQLTAESDPCQLRGNRERLHQIELYLNIDHMGRQRDALRREYNKLLSEGRELQDLIGEGEI